MNSRDCGGPRGASLVLALALSAAMPAAEAAAQGRDRIPAFPAGTPVVVLPVQSAEPLPGGEWVGGAASLAEVLEAMDAELQFSLAEQRSSANWIGAAAVLRRIARNPSLKVWPRRLAYQGLLRPIKGQIYEPLHGELRAVAALFNTRYLILPLRLRAQPADDEAGDDEAGVDGVLPAGDRAAHAEADAGAEAAGAEAAGAEAPRARRKVKLALLVALIDIRRSQVMWHGEIEAMPEWSDSPAIMAELARRVARTVAPQ